MRINNLWKLCLGVLFCLQLCACEYSYDYTYIIHNDADTTVMLHMKRRVYPDTTILVPAQVTDTLFITDHGLEPAHGPYFKSVTTDLSTATVTKKGLTSQRNYLQDSVWNYTKGCYTATVQNQEF